jgi:transcriptional regulator with XRE-family HTH domain
MTTPRKDHKIEKRKASAPPIEIGAVVRRLREEKKLSGAELCRRGKGIDPKTLTALEKGRIRNPSIVSLEALAKGLGMTVSGLFRRAELEREECFSRGTQKGLYKIELPFPGIQMISFTPLAEELFCGKLLVDPQKGFDERLLGRSGAVFIQVLIGRFEGEIDGKEVALKEGDNLFFFGGMKVRMANALQRNGTLLLVTAPSCFVPRHFPVIPVIVS